MLRAPQLDATLSAINAKLATVDEGMKQTTRLGELASEVDGKLAEQLVRRAELEMLKSQCDAVLAHTLDAQQTIEGVAARQNTLLPVSNRLSALGSRIEKTAARIDEVTRDEAVLSEQETRLAECLEMSRTLAGETTERMTQIQALGDKLASADGIKEELISELARIQTRQRDATAQVEATEDHLKRTDTMHKQFEQRRTQLAFSETKMVAVEVKMSDLAQRAAGLDQLIKGILERQAVVAVVKAEVDAVHDISARRRADLPFVTEHRDEVAAVRRQIKDLLATAHETEEKIAAIEERRKTVGEVQAKANLISNLLEDVSVNLETLGEQKSVIDHVAERPAEIDFTMQEAQNTLQTLQHERKLAERLEQSIKQLRTTTAKADLPRKSATS